MKNFIFAICGFLMMSLVSLSVQASSVESFECEYVAPSVDVGLSPIQFFTLEAAPTDCVVLSVPQPIFMITDSPAMQPATITAMQGKQILSVRSDISTNRSIVRIIATLHTAD